MKNLKVNYKYRRLRAQWAKLLIVNPLLVHITLFAFNQLGGRGTIIQILRTPRQQRLIYPYDPDRKSVHMYYRGIDIRTRGFRETAILQLKFLINQRFQYNHAGPHDTAVYHDVGHGPHLHLQTKTVFKLR